MEKRLMVLLGWRPLAASLTALDGILTLSQIVEKMSWNPAKILGIPAGTLKLGADADVVLFDPTLEWVVNENALHGKSRNTPFKGMHLKGKVIATFYRGVRFLTPAGSKVAERTVS